MESKTDGWLLWFAQSVDDGIHGGAQHDQSSLEDRRRKEYRATNQDICVSTGYVFDHHSCLDCQERMISNSWRTHYCMFCLFNNVDVSALMPISMTAMAFIRVRVHA